MGRGGALLRRQAAYDAPPHPLRRGGGEVPLLHRAGGGDDTGQAAQLLPAVPAPGDVP
ncbi:hypothetical protein [Streptomyces fradiae]|uniref:Uncharacterized protein n=1 Tax=Streptomyces fradiae ATCC 10745 = DSM 40063 TaxID=1319510 RepID=A0ABQ6XR38_STRFR|nr:hypothetical protein [Streptomyces fradiae]KAF0648226.1 hypothetical protein K701_19350 [Streptomyces fradiae ATCC 10745 = DSM 40063]